MVDWKKEIKLSDLVGGRKDKPADTEAAPPVPGDAPIEKTSIWKKEISFGSRKSKGRSETETAASDGGSAAAEQDFERRAAAAPEAATASPDISLGADGDALATVSHDVSATPPQAAPVNPVPSEVPQIAPAAQNAPLVSAPAPPAAPMDEYGAQAPGSEPAAPALDPIALLPAPAPERSEPVITPAPPAHPTVEQLASPASISEPEPTAEAPPPVAAAASAAAPAGEQALPPAVAGTPSPAQQPVHPPVPADELPPLEEERPRTSFLKREISFGRKRDGNADGKPKRAPRPPRDRSKGERASGRKASAKSLVGLKIGASQIAAARVANNGHAELHQVAREPLAAGIVVGGELREPDALADALKSFFAKHKLPKRAVRLGLANNRIGVRSFEIAGIEDPRQLENAVKFRAQDALPIPIEEAVLDYQIVDERQNAEGGLVRRILLVVAYRELVDRYVAACRKAGITLVGIDLEAFALLRSLAPQGAESVPSDAALVAVTVGHDRSTFAVSDGRACEFTRVVEWGGAQLNVAIARALDIAPSEAEPFKRELSLYGSEVPEGLTEAQAVAAREAVARQIQAFARELVSSLQFYQNQPGSLGIGEIAITGGTAHLPGLAQELERLIGVTVRVGDPLARVKVGKKFREPEQVGSLAVAIGLGIED